MRSCPGPSSLALLLKTGGSASSTVSWLNQSSGPVSYVLDSRVTGEPAPSAVETYGWTDSNALDGPAFVWNDISTTGTKLNTVSNADDGAENIASIGFSFPFYGSQFSSVWVCSNGYLYFGNSPLTNYAPYLIPTSQLPGNLVAGFLRDLDPGSGGDVYYKLDPERLTVQFQDVQSQGGGGTYTFQIVLMIP